MKSEYNIDPNWLREEYDVKGRAGEKIAADIGCCAGYIYSALRKHGIPVRSRTKLGAVTKEELRKLYWDDGLSLCEIAEIYNCDNGSMGKKMKKMGIKIRSLSGAATMAWGKGKQEPRWPPVNVTRQQLETWYWEENLSTLAIARKLGCSSTTVKRKMDENGIDTRTRSNAALLVGRGGKPQGYRVKIDEDVLTHEYVVNSKSSEQLGELFDCSNSTILRRLRALGVELRGIDETNVLAGRRHYEENLIRRGGVELTSLYSDEWNNEFRDGVRERDEYSCAVCRLFGNCIHHIDYDKQNTTTGNCITLCRRCHTCTNHHRKYWKRELHAIMVARGAA